MQKRYRQDAAYELSALDSRIASANRTLQNTAKENTAKISEAVLVSMTRQADALRAELATLPERPERQLGDMGGSIKFGTRDAIKDPFTAEELAGLEIPEFLRRYDW